MGIGNLLSKVLPTKKNGTKANKESTAGGQITYFIQFSNLEDNPIYELNSSLSIGSEIGDVILDDPSLSPNHCTIFRNHDVVSVVDHNSQEGTFVSEHQIPAGKMVILKDGDFIRAGELEIDIITQHAEPSELMSIPAEENNASLQAANSSAQPATKISDTNKTQDLEIPAELSSSDDIELSLDDDLPDDDIPADELSTSTMELDKTGEMAVPQELNGPVAQDFEQEIEDDQETKKPSLFARLFKKKPKVEKEKVVDRPKKEKKPSLFARIFKKKDKSKVKEDNQNKMALPKSKFDKKIASKEKINVVREVDKSSANAFTRALSLVCDFLIAYSFYIILEPLSVAWEYYELITNEIIKNYNEFIKPHIWEHISVHIDKVPASVWDIIKQAVPYIGALYVFIAYRIIFNLLAGASLGQLLMGMRAYGHPIWKRLGGVLRELLAPLLIVFELFNFMTLFGFRTFKEAITFTRLQVNSKAALVFGLILGFPLVIATFLVSPLLIGGKIYKSIEIGRMQAVKSKGQPVEEVISNYFKVKFLVKENMPFVVFPSFDLEMDNGKKLVYPNLSFYSQDLEEVIKLKKLKTFNLLKVLKLAVQSDFLIEKNFPLIKTMVTDPSQENSSFKKHEFNEKQQKELFEQITKYVEIAFGLDFEKIIDHAQVYGPFIKGYVDVREELKRLSNIEQLSSVSIKNIGNQSYLILSENIAGAKSVRISYIPLESEVSMVNQVVMSEKAFKNNGVELIENNIIANTVVLPELIEKISAEAKSEIGALEIFDFYFETFTLPAKKATLSHFYFLNFQVAKVSLEKNEIALVEYFKRDLRKQIRVFEVLQKQAVEKMNEAQAPELESYYNNLIKSLNELLNALEERNLEFFKDNLN